LRNERQPCPDSSAGGTGKPGDGDRRGALPGFGADDRRHGLTDTLHAGRPRDGSMEHCQFSVN
jgi:hypothetical protein